MIILTLPTPPSVNALYANRKRGRGRGRIKTKAYRDWLVQADKWLLTQKRNLPKEPVAGNLKLIITIPMSKRSDASNFVKAPEDFLVSRMITGDDRNNWEVTVKKDTLLDCCFIEILPIVGT